MLGQIAGGQRSFKMEAVGTHDRTPMVDFGPIRIQWVFAGDDLLYHIYRVDPFPWPPESAMREAIGTTFDEILGSSEAAVGTYTAEVDSWGVKLAGYGKRKGQALEMLTAEFGERLAHRLRGAAA